MNACLNQEHLMRCESLVSGYGMTEVVVLSHITPLGISVDDEKHLGSCGKLLPGFEAKVRHQKSFFCV